MLKILCKFANKITYKCRYASLGPVTFREAAVSFYFLLLVSLWFFQVAKFRLFFPGGKIVFSKIFQSWASSSCHYLPMVKEPIHCHDGDFFFCFCNFKWIFIFFPLLKSPFEGAGIHSWLGGLLCSAKRGAFSWSDFRICFVLIFISVHLRCYVD